MDVCVVYSICLELNARSLVMPRFLVPFFRPSASKIGLPLDNPEPNIIIRHCFTHDFTGKIRKP